ncbi:glucuronate isomerase [Chloroflexota bacterium]
MALRQDRFFSPNAEQRKVAQELLQTVQALPLVCPHGHVDPRMFADPDYSFGSPTEMLIIPDHYVFRMLYAQGFRLEELGVPTIDGAPVETDHRKIWQIFGENFYLFRGTPTGIWLAHELEEIFGITQKLSGDTAQDIYDQLEACLAKPEFRPRALFDSFNIEVLCTTDAATDTLEYHQAIQAADWPGVVRPTLRPDAVVDISQADWREQIDLLSERSGIPVHDYASYIAALEDRRAFFKAMGAKATDHAALTAYTGLLTPAEAEAVLQRALKGDHTTDDAQRFLGHMLIEMARMSVDDGLTMQVHVGSGRNHNEPIFQRFGRDKGADIPIASEFTRNIKPLLDAYGNNQALTLILFTLDESTYARELAPLAGHYPAVKLGPPWWFHDSLNGMRRYFDQVMETAGLYNTAGFNDDTRAFPSIPARHDVWRRAACDWVAGLVVRGLVDAEDGQAMVRAASYDLAKDAYNL